MTEIFYHHYMIRNFVQSTRQH